MRVVVIDDRDRAGYCIKYNRTGYTLQNERMIIIISVELPPDSDTKQTSYSFGGP